MNFLPDAGALYAEAGRGEGMLDERRNSDVEAIGDALRKLLAVEASPTRVCQAEAADALGG